MDLATLKKRVESGAITSTVQFERDLYLMFANAAMYNPRDDYVHIVAKVVHTGRLVF